MTDEPNKCRWLMYDADNQDVTDTAHEQLFDTRAEAEHWLSSFFQNLLDDGVTWVELVDEDDEEIIPPMSLLPDPDWTPPQVNPYGY